MREKQFTMKNSTQAAGFTIIELLVVIAILTLLMAMVVTKVGDIIENAKETDCRNNLKQLHTAFISYTINNGGNYPIRFADEYYDEPERIFNWHNGWVAWANSDMDMKKIDALWPNIESQSDKLRDDLGTGSVAKFGVEKGDLFQYMNKSFKHYVCPVMAAKKKDAKVSVYRTYAMGNRFLRHTRVSDNLNGAKTLVFTEVVPTSTEGESEKREKLTLTPNFKTTRNKEPGRRQGDCCISPKDDTGGEEFIAYDVYGTTLADDEKYGIHSAPGGRKASLAVFLDGHIEKVFSRTPNKKLNTAYYYVKGHDPYLED